MAYTLCKLVVIARIGGGAAQDIRLDPANQYTDVLQALDPVLVPLTLLPRKIWVYHSGAEPSMADCHDAVAPLVQNVGSGTFDISPTAVKTGHVLVGGVWADGDGFGFQLYENSTGKTAVLKARNTTNVATQIFMDWIVLVSF